MRQSINKRKELNKMYNSKKKKVKKKKEEVKQFTKINDEL